MAFGYRLNQEDSDRLRELTSQPMLTDVIVYDADFPHEVGQQFVQASLTIEGANEATLGLALDLTDPRWSQLSEELHRHAERHGETVKFFLDLTPPLTGVAAWLRDYAALEAGTADEDLTYAELAHDAAVIFKEQQHDNVR